MTAGIVVFIAVCCCDVEADGVVDVVLGRRGGCDGGGGVGDNFVSGKSSNTSEEEGEEEEDEVETPLVEDDEGDDDEVNKIDLLASKQLALAVATAHVGIGVEHGPLLPPQQPGEPARCCAHVEPGDEMSTRPPRAPPPHPGPSGDGIDMCASGSGSRNTVVPTIDAAAIFFFFFGFFLFLNQFAIQPEE